MFSYTMLATSLLFCYPDWPKRLTQKFPAFLRPLLPLTDQPQRSDSCVYPGPGAGRKTGRREAAVVKETGLTPRQWLGAAFTVIYVAEQFFLPYSHFITQ
eukprot:g20064.t1